MQDTLSKKGGEFNGHKTISDFVESQIKEASASGAKVEEHAQALLSMGFTASASIKYADFLQSYTEERDASAYYAEKYPMCVFLPWAALHSTIKVLDLWVDHPSHYLGAVPEGQVPRMEVFELDKVDLPILGDWIRAVGRDDMTWDVLRGEGVYDIFTSKSNYADFVCPGYPHKHSDTHPATTKAYPNRAPAALVRLANMYAKISDNSRQSARNDPNFFDTVFATGGVSPLDKRLRSEIETAVGKLMQSITEMRSDFFVVAPPEAFNTSEDWLSRARKIMHEMELIEKTPPSDPLVIRMVRGGCLVVAAWGDEAAHINEMVKIISGVSKL